jgi:hypothetical protein
MLAVMLLNGQDAKVDFKKINETYNTTETFSMSIKYELYLDGSTRAHETEYGKYMKYKKMYFTSQANSELIITNDYMFIIDKNTKLLAIDKRVDDSKIVNPLSVNLDSLYLLYSKIENLKSSSNSIRGYRFFIKEGPYSLCDVYFDTKTNFVTEIINVFRDKLADENNVKRQAVLKTTFYNISKKSSDYITVFDEKRYVEKNKEKFILSKNYKTFKFINHLN